MYISKERKRNYRITLTRKPFDFLLSISWFWIMMDFTCNIDEKNNHSPQYIHALLFQGITSLVLPQYFLRCRCTGLYIFSPVVDARWEHAAKARFCHNLMGYTFKWYCIIAAKSHHPKYQLSTLILVLSNWPFPLGGLRAGNHGTISSRLVSQHCIQLSWFPVHAPHSRDYRYFPLLSV